MGNVFDEKSLSLNEGESAKLALSKICKTTLNTGKGLKKVYLLL